MSELNLVYFGGIIILVVLIGAILVPRLMARRWKQHERLTVDVWKKEGISFRRGPVGGKLAGVESRSGLRQQMSIGYLAMTEKDLRLTRLHPFGVWIITYRQIKGIELKKTFIGNRAKTVPFVIVRFVQDGQADKIGFQVNDFEAWANDLAEAANVKVKDGVNDNGD